MNITDPKKMTFEKKGGFLGGQGTKDIYRDASGGLYIFKHATPKFGAKGIEPWRIFAQTASAFLTGLLKPDASIPVVAAEFEGIPGTVQPFIKCDAAHLPGHWELTPSIVKDIVLEHVADWIGSQHDSHIGQWVVTEDNRWICTDKEQGWKYFGKDSLSTSYHPNAVYGERPPLYNDFWKSWARGEIVMDFGDLLPQAFETLLKNKDGFEVHVVAYAKSCPAQFGRDAKWIKSAVARLITAPDDFSKFFKGLKP
jgi:hypothetical protein